MKNLFVIALVFLTLNVNSQVYRWCEKWNPNIEEYVEIPCDDPHGAPWNYRSMDMDSMLHSLSVEFFVMLNDIRVEKGLNPLVYDSTMYECVTLPHNTWQMENNKVSHAGSVPYFTDKLKRCGYFILSECCASNNKSFDTDTTRSYFLEQYEDSPSHWNSLLRPTMTYISISTLYNEELDKWFSTVNMR